MASDDAEPPQPSLADAETQALTEATASLSVASTPPIAAPPLPASPRSSANAGLPPRDSDEASLPPPGSTAAAAASPSLNPQALNAPPSLRPAYAIGSGRGGPPPRLSGVGSGVSRVPQVGARSIAGMNEKTKQMAATKLPPSLQARLAANANRSTSNGTPNSSTSPSGSAPRSPYQLGHNERLDANAFMRTGGSQSTSLANVGGPSSFVGDSGSVSGIRKAPEPPVGVKPGAGAGAGAMGPGSGLGGRRANKPGLKLSDIGAGIEPPSANSSGSRVPPGQLSQGPGSLGGIAGRRLAPPGRLAGASGGPMSTAFSNFSNVVDTSGRLKFDGKAVLSASGVEFSSGTSFQINMDDLELLDELGKGAYGTVRKVRHTKTGVEMAMKEIRLELDDAKLNAIIMELDILHRATEPQIVEFYGAFFIESCVYYCMEFMDAGSLENLYNGRCSVPEDVLARIVGRTVRGLRFLKDELQIMHRDVKPTNILINRKGDVKLCDFGVSGQLEKSLAKTNIGCQSYMAPERIKGESQNLLGTYTVASDVWSLGLTIVETTVGTYPYPPETYSNVFAQLQAIVHGDPPQLPDSYSETASDFVARCLEKIPSRRATYAQMLKHPWLIEDEAKGTEGVDMTGWVEQALLRRAERKERERERHASSGS